MSAVDVSVIVTTHDRCQACVRAVASALDQVPHVREVIVVDDASADATPQAIGEWAHREPRLRYERFERTHGGPAAGRNRGLALAKGELIAFLDDDDRWLPGKIARQTAVLGDRAVDMVATNAVRTSGTPYFPELSHPWRPTRADLLRANPIIMSSVVARRRVLLDADGFDERRWLAGIEDYDAWLRLADRGAQMLVLPETFVVYEDGASDRYGAATMRIQRALARHSWERCARHRDADDFLAALRRTSDVAITARQMVAAARATRRAARSGR